MKKVIICEKRTAAFELLESKVFGDAKSFSQKNGYIENQKFIIVWCAGHLYKQLEPREINEDYGLKFSLQSSFDYHMSSLHEEANYVPYDKPKNKNDTFYKEVKRRLEAIKEVLKRRDYDEIILAADADDEGERIHSDPIKYNRKLLPKNIIYSRFWNTGSYKSSSAVKKSFDERKSITESKYRNRLDAAKARSMGDYLLGMILTKVLTDYTGTLYRCGRILSTLIGMVGNRETQIKNFIPQDYWNIKGILKDGDIEIKFNHFYMDTDLDTDGNEIKVRATRYFSENEMLDVINNTKKVNFEGIVVNSTKRKTSSRKPKLYHTDDFNSDFMEKFGVTMDYSNAHLEWLRDFEYTSYPRTNGNYFNTDDFNIVDKGIQDSLNYFSDKIKNIQLKDKNFNIKKLDIKNDVFNNKKAVNQNHTPIFIEKEVKEKDLQIFASNPKYDKRNGMVLKHLKEAYDMIATRCLIQVMPDDIIEKENLTIDINGYQFEANAEKVIYLGWKQFDENASYNKNSSLGISYKEGDKIKLDNVFSVSEKTTVPPRYTQKSLLKAMMFINDALMDEFNNIQDPNVKKQKMSKFKEIKQQLKTANGLGTQATREEIFSKIEKDKVFIINKKKEIELSDLGQFVYKNLPEYLKSIGTTALWEQKLSDIRSGTFTYDDFISMVKKDIDGMVDEVLKSNLSQNSNKFNNNRLGKPTKAQIDFVKKISDKLKIKITKQDIETFEAASNFISKYKDEAFPSSQNQEGYKTLSENQIKFLLKDDIFKFLSDEIKQYLDKKTITIEEYKVIQDFIGNKINEIKNNPNNVYSLSDGQLKVLQHPKSQDKLSIETKQILKDKIKANSYSFDEYSIIKKDLDKIFNSFKK